VTRMPTVLVCWEMGGSLGHIAHLGILMRELIARGCRTVGVFRELHHVHHLIPQCEILPAPTGAARQAIAPTFVYSQLLYNCGFHGYEELRTRVRSWHTIFALTNPDILVCDHSPTAILAAHCIGIPTCTFGLGFFSPPDVWPPIALIPGGAPEAIQQAEDFLRDLVNRVLADFGRPPVGRMTELYSRVPRHFLATFEELDHFAEFRAGARYCGAWAHSGGANPEWRSGEGARIYAYLKPCPLLPALIGYLSRLPNPMLIYAPEVRSEAVQPLIRGNISLASRPADMAQVGQQCDAAILHATHGTLAAMFLAGKPCFHAPIYLEQAILANRLVARGMAMAIDQSQEGKVEAKFSQFLSNDEFASISAGIAGKYGGFDLQQEVAAVTQEIAQLAA
jgi:hypothetical protein